MGYYTVYRNTKMNPTDLVLSRAREGTTHCYDVAVPGETAVPLASERQLYTQKGT